MNWIKKLAFLLLIPLLLIGKNSPAAELTASVDQNIVQMGQYIQFSLSLSGKSSASDPDLSFLKQDFDVLSGMSKSSQTQIINGSMSSSNTWSVTISPKTDGAVIIPPLAFAGLQTQPITIVVGKSPTKEFSDVFFETTVSSSAVYVQAQLRLDLKLYIKMADLSNSQIDPLNISGAKVFQNGETQRSEITKNGIRYVLFSMSYFVYPEQSGELKIPSLRFQGVVNEGSRYSRFGTRRSISASSDAKTIKVLGIPSTYPKNAQWLPAEQILLAESFNPESSASVGEPITRTIITKAKGLPAAALPPVEIKDIQGLKIYPDQGKTDDKLDTNTLIGTRTDSFALIANQTGDIQLPDYKLPWWDTVNNKLRYAELKGKQLNISDNDGHSDNIQSATQIQSDNDKKIDIALNEKPASLLNINNTLDKSILNQKELTWLIAVFGGAWLLTVLSFAFYIRRLKKNNIKIAENNFKNIQHEENIKTALNAIKQACKSNNMQATRQALINWGNIQFSPTKIKGLSQLADLLNNNKVKASLKAIDSSLYEDRSENFDLMEFWTHFLSAIESLENANLKQEKGKALSQLYKV